ncbi:MAG: right-handed parallel beta-helix repeat-containing protein [Verrucomicrobiota bacterium]
MKTYNLRHLYPASVLAAVLLVCVAAMPGASLEAQAAGRTYYVAPIGNDKAPGTFSSPWQTIGKAAKTVTAGDTLYVRGGTYCEFVRVSAGGTASQPIKILAYSNEVPIMDGTRLGGYLGLGTNRTTGFKPFLEIGPSACYVTLSGFTLRNGSVGISSYGSNVVIRNMTISNMWQHGILAGGDNSLIENNTVTRADLACELAVGIDALNQTFVPEHPLARNITIRGNTVSYIGKGEGILTWMTDRTLIESNVVYDCGAENIYISDARNTLCRNNLSYRTTNDIARKDFHRQMLRLSDEEVTWPRSSGNLVINNLFLNSSTNNAFLDAFAWTRDGTEGTAMFGDVIANNTFVNVELDTGPWRNQGQHVASVIQNNIFYRTDGRSLAKIPNKAGLTFSHNLWSGTPPENASGIGDLIGDPKLAGTGQTGPGQLTRDYFALRPDSPALGKGASLYGVNAGYNVTSEITPINIGAYLTGNPFRYSTNAATYPLTILGNPADATTGAGGGHYVAGETIAINAVPYPVKIAFTRAARNAIYYDINPVTHPKLPTNDLVFQSWVINSGAPIIANTNAAITALTMPAGPVSITAKFIHK